MTTPICSFCTRPIKKSPRHCPQCRIPYHSNCWRQVSYCLTCGVENTEFKRKKERPTAATVTRMEAVSIAYDEMFSRLAPCFTIPGTSLAFLGAFLFLFKADAFRYVYMTLCGVSLYAAGKLLGRLKGVYHLVSPSTRSIQRHVTLPGLHAKTRLLGFDEIQCIRIEGQQRFRGAQKGVPTYYYNAFWIVAVTRDGRHVKLSDEVRTDQDENYIIGDEYEFGGLLPLAKKAGAAIGVDVYVAPCISPYRWWPLLLKATLLLLFIILVAVLF